MLPDEYRSCQKILKTLRGKEIANRRTAGRNTTLQDRGWGTQDIDTVSQALLKVVWVERDSRLRLRLNRVSD